MDFVAENISRAISLSYGRKVFDGKVRDLFKKTELITENGLRQPQAAKLSNAFALQCAALSTDECAAELEGQLRQLVNSKPCLSMVTVHRNP